MKNIAIIGQHERQDILLQVLKEHRLLDYQFTYQIMQIPGKEDYVRRLDPQLKKITAEEVVKHADYAFSMNKKAGENYDAMDFFEYLKMKGNPKHELPSFDLPYEEAWFPDVLAKIAEFEQAGYRCVLRSDDIQLDELFRFVRDGRKEADIELRLYVCEEKEVPIDIEGIKDYLLQRVRAVVFNKDYILRMYVSYHERWKKNIHIIKRSEDEKEVTIFLSCSRTIKVLTGIQKYIFDILENETHDLLSTCSRETLENFTAMCRYEEKKGEHFEALMKTGLAQIENYNDVILSFIGDKRCNMRCKYCFSDHDCAMKADMKPTEQILITDMLIGDRENVKLHIDNGIGGEPFLDDYDIKKRHNTMIAYKETAGVNSNFGLLTNGTLLTEKDLKWMKYHIPYLGFSLDGDKETNDNIRIDAAGNATYDKTVQAIRMVQNADWPVETGISCVITDYNTDITGLQKHMREELGVNHIVMKPVRAAETSNFALTYEKIDKLKRGYKDFFKELQKEGKKGNLKPLFTMLQPLDYAGRFFIRAFLEDRVIVKRCGAGEHIFSVDCDGKVYPCDSFNGTAGKQIANLTEGHHNKYGFQVPFVCEEKKELRCDKCWARYLCGGVCQYVQYLNNYKMNDVIRMECELAKFLIHSAVLFWAEARNNWKKEDLEKVSSYIREIGFEPMQTKDAFIYAPC